jgi:hypothetical protein
VSANDNPILRASSNPIHAAGPPDQTRRPMARILLLES